MKKVYLLASMVLAGGFAFGQQAVQQAPFAVNRLATQLSTDANEQPQQISGQRGGAFWSEDFANGLNSTNGTWTQGGADQIWKHSFFTTSGEWSTGTPAFASTTAANGYMLFDADSVNFIVSPNYVDRQGELISPSIDCSSEGSVLCEFEQNFRFCCATNIVLTLDVSNDGGTSWTSYPVDNGVATNDGSANPDVVGINISAVAANEGNVMLRFSFGGTGISHYYWAVDDINLSSANPDDVALNWSQQRATTTYNNVKIPYTMYPINHIQPIEFAGTMQNNGSNTQTVTLDVVVTDAGLNPVFTGSSVSTSLAAGNTVTDSTTTTFTPPGIVEDYTVAMTANYPNIGSDATPADNLDDTWFFGTSSGNFRRGTNFYTGSGLWNGDDGNGITNAFEIGTVYQMANNDDVTGISFVVNGNTDPGAIAYVSLYQDDGTAFNLLWTSAGSADEVTITAGMIPAVGPDPVFVYTPVPNISVNAGDDLVVVVGHYGGPDAIVVSNGNITPPDITNYILDGTDNTWYWMASTPDVRLHLSGSTIGVEEEIENGIGLSQNKPNPFSGVTTITYSLEESANVSFEVVDITGKVVYTSNEGNRAAGQYNIELNGKDFAAGAYYYSLTANDKRVTKKMMITK